MTGSSQKRNLLKLGPAAGVIAIAMCAPPALPEAEAAKISTTYGFVVTSMYHDVVPYDKARCPQGLNQGQQELYLRSTNISEAERKRLSHPDNFRELIWGKPSFNTDGKPMCLDPTGTPLPGMSPPMKVVQGSPSALGLNLDGTNGKGSRGAPVCAHEKFHGLNGERGVDNQFYRVVGCTEGFQQGAGLEQGGYRAAIRNGSWALLINLEHVDNFQNDDDVTVQVYASRDQAPFPNAGKPIPYKSLSVIDGPRYHSTMHGRIRNGVLTTDPTDLRILQAPLTPPGQKSDGHTGLELLIRGARLQLKVSREGATGVLAGYNDLDTYDRNFIQRAGSATNASGTAITLKYSCPSFRTALAQYADGYPDPATKRCTAISIAFSIEATPAFIITDQAPAQTSTN